MIVGKLQDCDVALPSVTFCSACTVSVVAEIVHIVPVFRKFLVIWPTSRNYFVLFIETNGVQPLRPDVQSNCVPAFRSVLEISMTSVTDHVHGRRLESFCHQSFFMFKFSIFGRVRVNRIRVSVTVNILFSNKKKTCAVVPVPGCAITGAVVLIYSSLGLISYCFLL